VLCGGEEARGLSSPPSHISFLSRPSQNTFHLYPKSVKLFLHYILRIN
jgi:hypothetical protein